MQIEQLGPYKIGRKIGRGGMGTVFAGTLVETGEPAAVKILSVSLAHDEGFRERFKIEIETLRKLSHPNIVRLYGFGEQDDLLYYAMELIDGRSLEDELQEGRRFSWREVTEYAIQICRALKHAHDRGVIHRDIKPANLLSTPEGQIKLSDFGIAKLFGATGATAIGGVLGTAEYMAPEQTDGRTITPRTDLYSLGGVMYTLLAGRPPFKAKTLVEMLQLQRHAAPDPVRRYAPDVPEELQFILNDLLAKDPDARIATAMVLSRRLEAMRHGLSGRIDPSLVTPTQTVAAPPIDPPVSMSSKTMTALGPPVDLPEPNAAKPPEPEYNIAPAAVPSAAPSDKTAAARRERALSVTADLISNTGTQRATVKPVEPVPTEARAGKFVTVSEEEHRRFEPAPPAQAHWLGLQTALLAAAVLLLGLGTWYLMQPASADRLYERISRAAAAGDNASLESAKEDVAAFLAHYPDDLRGDIVRRYEEQINLYQFARRADMRARSGINVDSATPLERARLEAMNYAKLNPEMAVERLSAIVDLYGGDARLTPADSAALKLAQQQAQSLQNQIEQRAAADLLLLSGRLDVADALESTDPTTARAMREAVVKLYSDKPWASAAVERAAAALAQRTAAGPRSSP